MTDAPDEGVQPITKLIRDLFLFCLGAHVDLPEFWDLIFFIGLS